MTKKDMGAEAFRDGFNCAQSVATTFCEDMNIEPELVARMASPLGGGLSRTAGTCGAVAGGLLVIGLKYGGSEPDDAAAKAKSYQMGKEFQRRFEERYGSTLCPRLLPVDISTDEGLKQAREKKLFETTCQNLVQFAIEELDKNF